MLTQEEFAADFCRLSGLSIERFTQRFEVIPCTCGSVRCDGWLVVSRDEKTGAVVFQELCTVEQETSHE